MIFLQVVYCSRRQVYGCSQSSLTWEASLWIQVGVYITIKVRYHKDVSYEPNPSSNVNIEIIIDKRRLFFFIIQLLKHKCKGCKRIRS